MLLSPSRLRPSLLSSLYIALLALRTYSALAGHAYIHPDEWFQSGEPLTAHLFGLDTLRTWEFDPAFPCRSMASIQLFNWPLVIYAKLLYPGTTPEPATLFRIQRLTFLVWSLGLDYAAYTLTQPRHRLRTLCLLASSSSVLAFQVRPFSNAVEAVTLALSLVALKHSRQVRLFSFPLPCRQDDPILTPLPLPQQSIAWATILGVVAAAGLFSRFTFPIFFLPVGLSFLFQSPFSRILTAAAGFLVTSLAHILYDTHHFTGTLSFHHIIIAPLNAFVYNVRTSNVVLHGVHPRWLHTAVNLPLIVGVGALLALPRASRCGGSFSARVLAAVLVTALLGLSISPHQEPRFLLPLVLPAVLLVGRSPVPRILVRIPDSTGQPVGEVPYADTHSVCRSSCCTWLSMRSNSLSLALRTRPDSFRPCCPFLVHAQSPFAAHSCHLGICSRPILVSLQTQYVCCRLVLGTDHKAPQTF